MLVPAYTLLNSAADASLRPLRLVFNFEIKPFDWDVGDRNRLAPDLFDFRALLDVLWVGRENDVADANAWIERFDSPLKAAAA